MQNGNGDELKITSPGYYAIVVKGAMDPSLAERFAGMQVLNEPTNEARLVGYLADQAALHGVLEQIYDLGFLILSVSRLKERA